MPSQYTPVAKDARLKKVTGNFATRAELIAACEEYASMGITYKNIATHVGVAATTVRGILHALKDPSKKIKILQEHRGTEQTNDTPVTVSLKNVYCRWKPTTITTADE